MTTGVGPRRRRKATRFEGSGDVLLSDLIRDGVTGISGQVGEAYMLGAVRPDILFPAYLAGFNLAEAFYLVAPSIPGVPTTSRLEPAHVPL